MKIVIDCFQHGAQVTGTDRFAFHLLDKLQEIDSDNSYTIICSNQDYVRKSIHANNYSIKRPWFGVNFPIANSLAIKLWKLLLWSRFFVNKPDVYYSVHNMNCPPFSVGKKIIVNNFDLIPLVLEEYRDLGNMNYAKTKRKFSRAVSNADKIISISKFSKKELVTQLLCPEDKIKVVYLAGDVSSDQIRPASLSNNISSFFLTIGGAEKRKNVKTVMKACSLLPEKIQKEFPLIIVGGDWQYLKLPPQQNTHQLFKVNDNELAWLYSHCSLFIFASTYEGFGLPLIEAGYLRAPIISSSGTSLTEITRSTIPTFTANNPVELKELINKFISNKQMLNKLTIESKMIADKYSWEKTVRQIHHIITSLQ